MIWRRWTRKKFVGALFLQSQQLDFRVSANCGQNLAHPLRVLIGAAEMVLYEQYDAGLGARTAT